MPLGGAVLGAGALSAGASIFGASAASKAQQAAAAQASATQMAMFQQAQAANQPYIKSGTDATSLLMKLLTPGADQSATLSQTPGFKFAQDWGNWAATNAGTTRGLGGNVLTAAQQYAEGLANQTFGTELTNLGGVAQRGQSAASSLGGNAIAAGGQIGSNVIGAGNAAAGADIASANAVGNLGSAFSNYALLSKFLGGNRGAWAGSTNQTATG